MSQSYSNPSPLPTTSAPPSLTPEQSKKYQDLLALLASYGSVAIAFSGGVDSCLLLEAAHRALPGKVIAVTASSASFPERERKEATQFCEDRGIPHFITETEELSIEGFAQNPPNRCYLCKKEIFSQLLSMAKEQGIATVCEGSNLDDLGDYRPGLLAIKELGIKSPLREAGLTKADIRAISHHLSLPTWKKPSFACLASRFVYGELITEEKLKMVGGAEELLYALGLNQYRVRIHGLLGRIEVLPEDFPRLLEAAPTLVPQMKNLGFTYVTLDLAGYRTGSMNETLPKEEKYKWKV